MLKKIDHIGFAVHSIDKARLFYEQVLGMTCERIEEVPSQKVRTAFFSIGDTHIELLEPTEPSSPIAKFLEKKGEGFHHIGYLSDNLEGELQKAEQNGYALTSKKPVAGAGGKLIAFLHPKSAHGILTEICEQK